jgi:hypothetical protein
MHVVKAREENVATPADIVAVAPAIALVDVAVMTTPLLLVSKLPHESVILTTMDPIAVPCFALDVCPAAVNTDPEVANTMLTFGTGTCVTAPVTTVLPAAAVLP